MSNEQEHTPSHWENAPIEDVRKYLSDNIPDMEEYERKKKDLIKRMTDRAKYLELKFPTNNLS